MGILDQHFNFLRQGLRRALGAAPDRGSPARRQVSSEDVAPYSNDDVPLPLESVRQSQDREITFLKAPGWGDVLSLNVTSKQLWDLCDGFRPVEEILALYQFRHEIPAQRIKGDLLSALQQFEALGLIEKAPKNTTGSLNSRDAGPSEARPSVYGIGWPFQACWSSNSTRKPRQFDWTHDRGAATVPITVCIDQGIREGLALPGRKIAWLLESPPISQMQRLYDFIESHLDQVLAAYDVILSCDRAFCELADKIQYHPAGSNLPWIPEQQYRIYPKTKLCSMFASAKQMVEGHRIRHDYARKFKDHLDLFGGACGSPKIGGDAVHPDKSRGLIPYMFSITMENCRTAFYYSEKITDCFVTGTVPVYWGSDDIFEIFDRRGVLILDDDFDIGTLSVDLYYDMMPHIETNFAIATSLEGADDLLFDRYIRDKASYSSGGY